jgi:hydrogenase maturation protease
MTVLVIGYGNMLRRDDGVGPRVAQAVAKWDLPEVQTLPLPQLTPELTEMLIQVDQVYFIDADPSQTLQVSICPLSADEAGGSRMSPHSSDPHFLLHLCHALYRSYPQAWWVMVPAKDFRVGTQLSAVAESGMQQALDLLFPRLSAAPLPPGEQHA